MSGPAESLRYRPVARSIRPPRAATFVCAQDDWRSDVMRMIECYSRTWGGDGNGLVAYSNDGDVAEPFWPLLAAFDADHMATFQRTPRGLRMADPAAYEAELAAEAAAWAERNGISDAEARERLETDEYLSGPDLAWPTPLDERIRRTLAPLASLQVAVHAAYKADEPPPRGLVDMCELTYRPTHIAQIDLPGLPPALRLLVAARTGAAAPGHRELLEQGGTLKQTSVPVAQEHFSSLLELAWTGQVDTALPRLSRRIAGEAEDVREPEYASPQFLADTPLAHSRLGCTWFTRFNPQMYNDPLVVVCGDSAEDFCYAFTRQRVVGFASTCWLPITPGQGDEKLGRVLCETLTRVLPRLARGAAGYRPVVLASLTLTAQQLDELLGRLTATLWGHRLNSSGFDALQVRVSEIKELATVRTAVLLDTVHFSDVQHEPFLGAELARTIEIPRPSLAVGRNPDSCRWQVDVETLDHVLPARWALQPALTADGALTPWAVRSSTAGISVDSHGRAFTVAGSPPSQMLVQARLRFPAAAEIFSTLLAGSGATLEESDKGRFTRRMIELWGGLSALAADLGAAAAGSLLEAWVSPTVDGDLGRIYQDRKYLRLDDVTAIAGLPEAEARELLDGYLRRAIAARGLVLKCGLCANTSFYGLEDLGAGFRCQRCRQHNEIVRAAWNGPQEPQWFYGLDEVAHQGLSANIHVPVLAMAALSKNSRSFLHMPEAVVHWGEYDIEVDIWAIVDGRIVIGEAKKSDQLETTARKERQRCAALRDLARELSADEFVMATEGDGWAERTKTNVQHAIGSVATVRWLTGQRRAQA